MRKVIHSSIHSSPKLIVNVSDKDKAFGSMH